MRTVIIFAVVAGLASGAEVAGLASATCVTVPSSNILARDLSSAIPLLRALEPETIISFAPFPGTARVLSSRDVALTARRYGLAFPPGETAPSVCVERFVCALSPEEVRAALLLALDVADVRLELLAFSNQPL